MNRTNFNLLILACLIALPENSLASVCLVSKPNIATPKPLTVETPGYGWYGDEKLAALIPSDGIWRGMGPDYNYRNKLLWWEKGNSLSPRNGSEIEISAINLDNNSTFIGPVYAGNIFVDKGSSWGGMLTALEFPSVGCWRIIGWFKGHEIEFSVLVSDQ